MYRGLFRCGECGCFITTETQKGHNYLRCTKRVKKDCSQPYVREEGVADQIREALESTIVPEEWTDWMAAELQRKQKDAANDSRDAELLARQKLDFVTGQIDRLMTGYLDKMFSDDEYRGRKAKLLQEKTDAAESLAKVLKQQASRFEPELRFVKALKQATIVASTGNQDEQRDLLKTVGSNLEVVNRTLRFVPRNAWKPL